MRERLKLTSREKDIVGSIRDALEIKRVELIMTHDMGNATLKLEEHVTTLGEIRFRYIVLTLTSQQTFLKLIIKRNTSSRQLYYKIFKQEKEFDFNHPSVLKEFIREKIN